MKEYRLGRMETRFADIIWAKEPLSTRELVSACEKELGWKRTTTYTVLKKLCERGLFRIDNSTVTSLVPRESVRKAESRDFVELHFGGSLPAFLNAFTDGRRLTEEEAASLRKMIEEYEEGGRA